MLAGGWASSVRDLPCQGCGGTLHWQGLAYPQRWFCPACRRWLFTAEPSNRRPCGCYHDPTVWGHQH